MTKFWLDNDQKINMRLTLVYLKFTQGNKSNMYFSVILCGYSCSHKSTVVVNFLVMCHARPSLPVNQNPNPTPPNRGTSGLHDTAANPL